MILYDVSENNIVLSVTPFNSKEKVFELISDIVPDSTWCIANNLVSCESLVL